MLFFSSAFVMSAQTAPPASYVRTFINDVPNQPLVSVSVTGAVNVACFTIEETLPASATPLNVSGDGVYLPAQNAIRWGPYFNTVATNVSYRLTGLPASYPVDGGTWMDGHYYFSPGVTMVTVLPTVNSTVPTAPPQVATPTFSPGSGSSVPASVTISCATPGATIYYTLDGSLPTQSSTPYTVAVPLTTASVLRAAAFTNGWVPSVAAVAFYEPAVSSAKTLLTRSVTGNSSAAPMVTLNVTPATNATCIAITETIAPGIGAINISSGGNYIASNNVVLWGPFFGTNVLSLSYQAAGLPGAYPAKASWSVDGVSGGETTGTNLVIVASGVNATIPTPPPQAATPVFAPPSGANVPVGVTITDATPGAVIYFTLDGSLPTQSSALYTGAVPLPSAGVVRAAAFVTGYAPSAAGVAYYGPSASPVNAQVTRSVSGNSSVTPMVTFNITPGTGAQCSTLTETLPAGISVFNVSSGGNYIASNNLVLWGPFLGTNVQTLSYQATGLPGVYPVKASWSVDGVGGGETTGTNLLIVASGANGVIPSPPQQVLTPVLTPAISSNLPVNVAITDATPGAAIYYTLDGSLPTQGSTLYTGALPLTSATVLRAVAFLNGWTPSVAAVGEYVPVLTTNTVAETNTVAGNATSLPLISLTTTPQGAVDCYAVVEIIPFGLTPSSLSGDGIWDPVAGAIRWGPYEDDQPRAFSFNVSGASGIYSLSGQVSVNGYSMPASTAVVQINAGVIGTAPQIGTQPTNQVALAGSTVQFTVGATGASPLIYQWFFNTNTPLFSPSVSATLSLTNITKLSAGYYSVLITNVLGSITSSVASLTVITPLITNIVRSANGNVTLNFIGLPNVSTRIWAATNLDWPTVWLPIFTNTTTTVNGTWQFIDTHATGYPVRFYRFSTP